MIIKPIQPIQDIYQSRFFSPVRTGIDFVAKNLTGLPLVGTVASGIGSMFQPMSPQDRFNQQNFSLGGNPQLVSTYGDNRVGNLGGQDPYGINTVSAFGNYDQYALNKAFELANKTNLTPFQQQKMEFYEDVIRKNRDQIITSDIGFEDTGISGSGSSYDSDTGGTFGSSVDDASTFSDYS
tara:strand:+ start:463 stop:1005 length:543 start_codon:yes stop_codon:yes gene_type:complete